MRFDGIIFDFDGTIADTSEGVLNSIEYALDKLGLPRFNRSVLRGFIGPALYVSFQRITGLSPSDALRAIDFYREYYHPKGVYQCTLFPGIKELLEELKTAGKSLSIASSKPQPSLDTVTRFLDIDGYFDKIVGAALSVKTNDKAELVSRAITVGNSVMVGDAIYDVQSAKAVGLSSVAVTYGFTDRKALVAENPDFVADTVEELRNIIIK